MWENNAFEDTGKTPRGPRLIEPPRWKCLKLIIKDIEKFGNISNMKYL